MRKATAFSLWRATENRRNRKVNSLRLLLLLARQKRILSFYSAFEMAYNVSGGALNSTHQLTHSLPGYYENRGMSTDRLYAFCQRRQPSCRILSSAQARQPRRGTGPARPPAAMAFEPAGRSLASPSDAHSPPDADVAQPQSCDSLDTGGGALQEAGWRSSGLPDSEKYSQPG